MNHGHCLHHDADNSASFSVLFCYGPMDVLSAVSPIDTQKGKFVSTFVQISMSLKKDLDT